MLNMRQLIVHRYLLYEQTRVMAMKLETHKCSGKTIRVFISTVELIILNSRFVGNHLNSWLIQPIV
jgi:hypothetical protein